ncbi:TonB-dependent receptor, partial [Bacteroides cellulosilyticus]
IRLKNLEIGYSLPKKWLQNINVQGIRVYFSGYNLLTLTSLKYLDPEYSADTAYSYPISKTFTLGLNFKFYIKLI